jgi:hypothetical protein
LETREIVAASDPKNLNLPIENQFKIYYFIKKDFNPEDSKYFKLNKTTRELSLEMELDREAVDFHQIQIIATNSENYPSKSVSENATLTVNITVNDVNDNPPSFVSKFYAVGISQTDNMDKTLIKLYVIFIHPNDRFPKY